MTSFLKNKLNNILIKKKTNVIISADLERKNEIIDLIEKVGSYIAGIKLHSDIIMDWDINFVNELEKLKDKYNFIIIEDRKFCDIGNIVKMQSELITKYADLITVHSISGIGILEGLKSNCLSNNCGILLIAQMSSNGNLINKKYTEETILMAKKYQDIIVGFICQEKLCDNFFHFTPGVQLNVKKDNYGQQYNTPEYLVNKKNIDFLIIGRGIYQSENKVEAAKKYIYLKNKVEATEKYFHLKNKM